MRDRRWDLADLGRTGDRPGRATCEVCGAPLPRVDRVRCLAHSEYVQALVRALHRRESLRGEPRGRAA